MKLSEIKTLTNCIVVGDGEIVNRLALGTPAERERIYDMAGDSVEWIIKPELCRLPDGRLVKSEGMFRFTYHQLPIKRLVRTEVSREKGRGTVSVGLSGRTYHGSSPDKVEYDYSLADNE